MQYCVLMFSRTMAFSLWMRMFDDILNIRSCSALPDLMSYRKQLMALVEARVTVSLLCTYVHHLQQNLSS